MHSINNGLLQTGTREFLSHLGEVILTLIAALLTIAELFLRCIATLLRHGSRLLLSLLVTLVLAGLILCNRLITIALYLAGVCLITSKLH